MGIRISVQHRLGHGLNSLRLPLAVGAFMATGALGLSQLARGAEPSGGESAERLESEEGAGESPQKDAAASSEATDKTSHDDAAAEAKPGADALAEGYTQQPAPKLDAEASQRVEKVLSREEKRRQRWKQKTEATELPYKADVLGLTVSGGVSLGAYEAGQVYLLTEALKASPDSAKLMVASGASAGNANALMGATEACRKKAVRAQDSLGYRIWVDVGLDDLFKPDRVTSRAVFVQDALDEKVDLIKERWQKGTPDDCEFVFGLSVTRKTGLHVELAQDLVVPRQTERVVVHVQGRKDQAPAFSNYVDPARSLQRPLLPLSDGDDPRAEKDAEALRPAVLASAAFPVAFSPVGIPHCLTERPSTLDGAISGQRPTCEVATRVDEFIDGGVFDNNPLGITYRVAREGLIMGEDGPTFRDVPTGRRGEEARAKRPELIFGFVDPDLRSYPIYTPPKKMTSEEEPLLKIISQVGGEAVASARGQELSRLAETQPDAARRLWLLKANYPPVSELLGAFFGFFERDVRDFDFYLGAYDAYVALRDETGTILGTEPFIAGLEKRLAGPLKEFPPGTDKLGCMLAHFEPDEHSRLAPLCDQADKNFRILLQTTILRLWSNCMRLESKDTASRDHLQCIKAQGGLPPPIVSPEFSSKKGLFRREKESEFDYAIRLLQDFGFHFEDLGLAVDESQRGRLQIRRKLDEMVRAISDAQPGFGDRTVILTAGRTLVNGIEYEPPVHRWYVMVGSALAVGHLGRFGRARAWYWNVDARVHALQSLITDRPNEFRGSLSLGAEWALLPLSGSLFQTSFGLRGGYQPSAEDSIGFDPCDEVSTGGDSRACSQPLIHVPLNLTLLERVRFSLTPTFYPMPQDWGHTWFDMQVGLGAELF